jgi:KDO2-lipid IV(A) lauroyltransferase
MREHRLDSHISYYAIYYAVRFLPRRLCRRLGQWVALLVFAFSKKDRSNLARNFSMVMDKSPHHPDVRNAVRNVFLNYARYMVDFFLFPQLPAHKVKSYFSTIKGRDTLDQALDRGKGVLLVSAHIGNWEIGGNLLRVFNYPLTVVGLAHNTDQTNALVDHLRRSRGIDIIEVGDSTFSVVEILNTLRQNRIVAMIGDQDHLGTGQLVRFLGKQMRLPPGPVILAMMSGAALIPTFVLENPDGTYSGILEAPLKIETRGNSNQAIRRNLQRLAGVFEAYIKQYPDQWYCPDPLIADGMLDTSAS